jgi:hypothetical protein
MWTSTKSRFDFEPFPGLKNGTKWAARAVPEAGAKAINRFRSSRNSRLQDGRSGAQGLTDDSTIGDAANNGRASRGESNIGTRRTPSLTKLPADGN